VFSTSCFTRRYALGGGLELVGRVQDQRLAGQEQPEQLERFEDRALAVLAGDDQPALPCRPLPVGPFSEDRVEHLALPVIQVEAGASCEFDRLRSGGRHHLRSRQVPRRNVEHGVG
jgi:hypothetical protein